MTSSKDAWGFAAPTFESCKKMLEKNFGTPCPLYDDADYAAFARWLQEDNRCLFTVMLCAYANHKNPLRHIDKVKQ